MSRLTAYRVPPQQEFRAARELREHGHRAYVPRDLADKRRPPIARGYVFSGGKHAFARHVRSPVGPVPTDQLARLYGRRPKVADVAPIEFQPGDRVRIKPGALSLPSGDDVTGTLERRKGGRGWWVDIGMPARVVVLPSDMIRIDPG